MKNKLLKIFAFLILSAVAVETVSSIWTKTESSVVQTEKSGKEDNKGGETEKEECKDKLFLEITTFQNATNEQTLFVLSHIYIKYSAYLSLPEIPPELA